jgi:ATP-dependent DNA helicase RecG
VSLRADPATTGGATTLRNVLLLEQRRGFDDRAVVGGLSALVQRLEPDLGLPADLAQRVHRYAALGLRDRKDLVSDLLAHLQDGPTQATPSVTKPAKPSEPRPAPVSKVARGSSLLPPSTPIAALPGVGPTRARRLAAMDLNTAGDLRHHLPNRYVYYPPPKPASLLGFEDLASFEGLVTQLSETHLPGGRRRIAAVLRDDTGSVGATWIRGGHFPLGIHQGQRVALSGSLIRYGRQITFENPEFEPADNPPLHTRRAVPVYPLTTGISQLFIRGLIRDTLERLPPEQETLPDWLLAEEGLLRRQRATDVMHAPESDEAFSEARERLAFDELLPIELLVLNRRRRYQALPAPEVHIPWPLLAELRRQLPFTLTGGQQRALSTLLDDLARPSPMIRLLQGDVGSGKTVVAAMAILAVIAGGAQAAILAPTEILAEQHYRTLSGLFDSMAEVVEQAIGHPINVRLLTGGITKRERDTTLDEIRSGQANLIVGTHAVIQGDVEFDQLALAVIDEQHRFGVEQRMAIRQKGANPHLLVMTATPIPRTLALTVYGDLDLSLIDEMPPGRQPVETILLQPEERRRAYTHVRAEVAAGHQAFVICPLVEGSVVLESRAAVSEYAAPGARSRGSPTGAAPRAHEAGCQRPGHARLRGGQLRRSRIHAGRRSRRRHP